MRTTQQPNLKTQQPNLKLVYAIGIPTVVAIGCVAISTMWLVGTYIKSAYLDPQIVAATPSSSPTVISPSRHQLENKHRGLLRLSGFKDNVNLKSLSDEQLINLNKKLEQALRDAS